MDERELNRAIDTAAGKMIGREPGRSLSHTVMARVREGHTPAPRRFVWMTAAAGVLCGAVAIALMSGPAATVIPPPRAARLPIAPPPVVSSGPATVVLETPAARRRSTSRIAGNVAAPVRLPPNDVSAIEPIETEPIVLSAIEVPQLEPEITSIETLDIEPLTIEPLALSND